MPQPRRSSGKNPPRREPTAPEALAAAAEVEQAIADEAAEIRGEAESLTFPLFLKLYPLLRRPIPSGYIETISRGEGKPYDSTGVRSVQVQHGRMNNVLTPLWWSEAVEYDQGGKLCHVTITVPVWDDVGEQKLVREAWGGVDRGSTLGNTYKGSYTNAAKLAFARIGPGHEVYIGATDFDPDVSEEAAAEQAKGEQLPPTATISADQAAVLRDHFDAAGIPPEDLKVKLGSMGVSARSVNKAFAALTPAQATDLDSWMADRAVGAEANGSG